MSYRAQTEHMTERQYERSHYFTCLGRIKTVIKTNPIFSDEMNQHGNKKFFGWFRSSIAVLFDLVVWVDKRHILWPISWLPPPHSFHYDNTTMLTTNIVKQSDSFSVSKTRSCKQILLSRNDNYLLRRKRERECIISQYQSTVDHIPQPAAS